MARRRQARLSLRVRRRTFRATPICRHRVRVRWLLKQRARVRSYKKLFRSAGENEDLAEAATGDFAGGSRDDR